MNKAYTPTEARKLWVEALRSGEYEQGQGYLHKGNYYCCLGVACEVYQKVVGGLQIDIDISRTSYDNESATLPPTVQTWLGVRDSCVNLRDTIKYTAPGVDPEDFFTCFSLTELNDEGMSFNEIADLVESGKVVIVD